MKKNSLIIFVLCTVISLAFGSTAFAKSFKDVPNNFWAKEEINYLSEKEIINGYPNGNFGPNDSIRRVDAAKMIVLALDLDTYNRPNPNFKDITRSSYGFEYIATVADEGIFQGTNGYFNPNTSLTRAEMAAIVVRAFGLPTKSTTVSFKDVSNKFWAYGDIRKLVAHGITTGYPDKTFKPLQNTSRAEFSVFLTRALKQIDEKAEADKEKDTDKDKNETTEPEEFDIINIS